MSNITKTNQLFLLLICQVINTSITQTNQLITLMICQTIKNNQFPILVPHSFKQKKSHKLYIGIDFGLNFYG